MKKDITYVNSLGESICFGTNIPDKETPWHFRENDIWDYKLEYKSTGGVITSFYSPIVEKSIEIFTHSGSLEERDRLIDVINYDASINARGKLYAGSTYMQCNINGIEDVGQWHYSDDSYACTAIITSDRAVWIREEEITLTPATEVAGGLDFPYDYKHDYGYDAGSTSVIVNPFKTPCKCNIMFPGPCNEPYIIIAGNRYQVLESAEKGSLIIIRAFGSDRPQVVLKSADGSERNIIGKGVREPGARIFEKVPVGKSVVSWRGGYNVGLVLCEERPTACWNN